MTVVSATATPVSRRIVFTPVCPGVIQVIKKASRQGKVAPQKILFEGGIRLSMLRAIGPFLHQGNYLVLMQRPFCY